MRNILLAGVAFVALSSGANAAVITTASLFSPIAPVGGTTTVVGVQGVTAPSSAFYIGTGYTISFSGVGSDQGIVKGSIPSNIHATPVAGVSSGVPQYLSGDFGSALTSDANAGNYLSTALGSITITFAAPQISLALLWGSIDASNSIKLNNVAGDTVTGVNAQAAAAGFAANGFQGPGGSAYVQLLSDTTFTTVTLTSGVISFESAGIVGSTSPFNVPEPVSLALLGSGLLGLGLIRRRKA